MVDGIVLSVDVTLGVDVVLVASLESVKSEYYLTIIVTTYF